MTEEPTTQLKSALPRDKVYDGWTLNPEFLVEIRHAIQNSYDEDTSLEVIEAVLLAAEDKLTANMKAFLARNLSDVEPNEPEFTHGFHEACRFMQALLDGDVYDGTEPNTKEGRSN